MFNPGEATLITTAPLYALLLAAVQAGFGAAPHLASPVLSVAGLWAAAWGVWEYGRRRTALAAFLSGFALLTAPLAWLTIGFETPMFLAASMWAFVAARRSRLVIAGALAAAAMGLRGDGLLVAAVIGTLILLRERRVNAVARFVFPIALLYGALAAWLTLQFGTPIPSTLQSKSAQALSGLTGFYPFTTYLEGAGILLWAWASANPIFLGLPIATGIGAICVAWPLRRLSLDADSVADAALPFWTVLHVAGYAVLGVAPYVWYFAPLLPGLSWLMGYGMASLLRRWSASGIAKSVVCLMALGAMIGPAHAAAGAVMRGAVPPSSENWLSKTLPETKVDIYERAGRWIEANTPVTATIGVSELGVMAYFSERFAVDFLGLTRPDDLADVRHGDFLAGVLREFPDLMLLPMRNAIYDVDPQQEQWFLLLYEPVTRLEDRRFWGSPLTIWRRREPAAVYAPLPSAEARTSLDGWTIEAVAANVADLSILPPGNQPLLLRALLRAGPDAARQGNRLLRMQPILVDGGDGLFVASRVIRTDSWRPGEARWVDFPGVVTRPARQAAFAVEFTWEDAPEARAVAAYLPAQPECGAAEDSLLLLSDGYAVGLDAPPAIAPGAELRGRMVWRAGRVPFHAHAFVHLRNAAGETVAQDDHVPRHRGATFPSLAWQRDCLYEDEYQIVAPQNLPPGQYTLTAGLYDPLTGVRLPVAPAPHRTADGAVQAARIEVR